MIKLQKGQTIELDIEKMAYGGRGIGRVDGFVVFLKGVAPGDKVQARVYKKKKAYAEAGLEELITPSPDRVQAPCPYSGYCGGCQWQHIQYAAQLSYKKEQVEEAIEHIGGLTDVRVRNVLPSEEVFGYRNKMEFSFSDRRWFLPHELDKRAVEGNFALGLHVPGTYQKVIDVEACLLQQETGNQILREVKRYAKESAIPVYGLKSHEGFWRFLTIRYSKHFDEWMVNLVTSKEMAEVLRPLADTLTKQIEQTKTVINNVTQKKASIAVGEREFVLRGKGFIRDKIGPLTFKISANSFFQTNTPAAQKLYEKVVDYAELKGSEMVLDLYSGTGTIPIFLANRVRAVTGMEIGDSAVLDARRNCQDNNIDNCHFIVGDIRKKLSTIAFKPDVLIIDPPRAGMHKDVLGQVLALSPEKIIYISCNPATMARDISHMIQDYELVEIQPVDMFPHTYHIEAVAKLWLRK
jgi:23S rRNA (uracil1939-C5)-methyltransferase